MDAPLNYSPEMLSVMADVSTRTKLIDGMVADLNALIKPFVAESAGQAFSTLQQAVDAWQTGATEHTAVQTHFVRESEDSYHSMIGVDRQAASYFQV